ncbi:MAG: CO dehydrogenase/CO-methylating acetyl-CoA synthase complex subunit beta [Candidatus Bathyarchaeia archaeon]
MFEDIPVEVSVEHEGERIRRIDTRVEFGGPKVRQKFELARVRKVDEVEDGKVTVIGPDIKDMEEGSSQPIGIIVDVAGKKLTKDLESVLERRIHAYINYIEGFMHLAQCIDVWLRISKSAFEKGLDSFTYVGKVLERLYKSDLPIVEKVQTTFITDPLEIEKEIPTAIRTHEERDARARGLTEEEVEAFYGCTLCQSFAPTHVCVITPERFSACGSISWFDAKASAKVDPNGPNFKIAKGECLDPLRGEWGGVNDAIKRKSMVTIFKVYLHSIFGHPHTSCGCFEAIAFYIPEVDGIGIVNRGFEGAAVNGIPFSTMATHVGGGSQVEGFTGISINYMRSPKFLQADGGWNRIVWLPQMLKEGRIKDDIPEEIYEKIATEADVANVKELKGFLTEVEHPVISRWEVPTPKPGLEKGAPAPGVEVVPAETVSVSRVPAGRIRIILKNVEIYVKRAIIKRTK